MKRKIVLLNSCKGLYGGVESYLLNVFRDLDKNLFEIVFLTCGISTYGMYQNEIVENGGILETITPYPSNFKKQMEVYKKLKKYFDDKKPDVVHVNSSALSFQILSSKAASDAGVNNIILHSHNFIPQISGFRLLYRNALKKVLTKYGTRFLSCSTGASEWMFENSILDKVEVIPNGIRTTDFLYSEVKRGMFRKKIGLQADALVLGNIGRFQKQKNHKFMIDILHELRKKNDKAYLLLVGEGELKEEIKKYVSSKELENYVQFLGERKDIGDFLASIDIFIFPSLFEGFGIAALEAQASGAKTLVSNTIPIDVNVTNEVSYLPLNNVDCWVEEILEKQLKHKREEYCNIVENSKYDAHYVGLRMQSIYLEKHNYE